MSESNHVDDVGTAHDGLSASLRKGVGGTTGGTKLRAMMAQAEENKRMGDPMGQIGDFTGPLDLEDEDFA